MGTYGGRPQSQVAPINSALSFSQDPYQDFVGGNLMGGQMGGGQMGGSSLMGNIGNYMSNPDWMGGMGDIMGGIAGLGGLYLGYQQMQDTKKNNSLYRKVTQQAADQTANFHSTNQNNMRVG